MGKIKEEMIKCHNCKYALNGGTQILCLKENVPSQDVTKCIRGRKMRSYRIIGFPILFPIYFVINKFYSGTHQRPSNYIVWKCYWNSLTILRKW